MPPSKIEEDVAIIKLTIENLSSDVKAWKEEMAQRLEGLDTEVGDIADRQLDDRRRIGLLEADTSSEQLLKQMQELKATWTANQNNMWKLIFVLIAILAVVVGATKLPSLPI